MYNCKNSENEIYLLTFKASFLVLTSCKEEEIIIDPNPSGPSLSCKIDGEDFSDNSPEISVNGSDMMSIKLSEVLDIKVYSFSQRSEGETIYFSVPGMGIVSYGSTYSSTYNGPPYDGQIVFTTLEDETLSGTFSFKAQDVDPTMFTNIWVTEGVFENISY